MNNKMRKEMTTKDGTHLVVMKDEITGEFWWFNFRHKDMLFRHSDGNGNAKKYYEEVKRFIQE